MLARWKMRRVFRIGGATYEHATMVMNRKSVWMVIYLRSRRRYSDVSRWRIREVALQEKRWARRGHLGLDPEPGHG